MVPHIKISRAEPSINVNDVSKGGEEDGHRVVLNLHKGCTVMGRNNGRYVSL